MRAMIDNLLHHPGIEAFGLAILHSLWQGALIATALFIVLQFVKNNANLRYLLACGALLSLLLAFGYTFYLSYTPPVQVSNDITPEFTASNHLISQVFISQSAEVDEEVAFSFANVQAAVIGWIERNSHYIFLLWLAGFLVFSSRLCLGLYYARKLKRSGQQPEAIWTHKLDQFRCTLGIRRVVRLLTSTQVHTPFTLGWIRPVILLPVGMLTQLPCEHIESILLHELAHIRRQDYLVNLLQSVVESLLFFNPAYWYMARIMEKERENACDDVAVGIMQKPVHYARALTRVAELSRADGVLSKATVAASRGSLTERIRRIVLASAGQTMQRSEKAKWYLMGIIAMVVLAAVMITAEVRGHQSEKNVEIEVDADPEVDIEEEVDVNLDVDKEEEVDIDIEKSLDLDIEVEAMGVRLDSSSLYNFLHSQWEYIKKRKIAKGEEVPDNVLLSNKTLYIIDGEARNPRTVKPPFDYTISIPHTVMWAAILSFDFFDIEDSYAAFRKKYPGDYSTVVFLTSKALKDAIDPDEPFTVTGQVFDGKTKAPIAGAKVLTKETSTSTITDDVGNFSLRVPNAEANLVFSHEEKGYRTDERSVEWYRNKKMYVRLLSSDWLKKIKPDVEVKVHKDDGNPQKRKVSFKETLNSSDTGTVKGKASAIVLEIDENREDLPLYLVDGIEVSPASVKKLDSQSLGEIEVIQKETAVKLYGEKGKNGVVLVTTNKALREARVQLSSLSNSEQPLFIIDGKQIEEQQISLLKPNDIASINVLKGEEAKKIYGEKGKNGVILITTKARVEAEKEPSSPREDSRPPIFIIDGIRYTYQELSNFNAGNGKFITIKSGNSEFQVNLDPDDIISMNVVGGGLGITSSGRKPVDVVFIKTKSGKFGKAKAMDVGPSFQEVMVKATDGMLDTMTVDEIYNYHLTVDQMLNRQQESIGDFAEKIDKPTTKFDFSGDKVLFLLDGVKADPQSIRPYNLESIEVIRREATTSYQKNMKGYGYLGNQNAPEKFEEYLKKYPGDYDAVVVATSRSKPKVTEQSSGLNETSNNLKVFPNPSENIFTIELTLAEDAPVQATVIDAAGRRVTSLTDHSLGKGTHELKWDASGQKPGLYRIRIIQNGETTYRNVLVK